jgi:hypothetical protein
MQQLTLWDGEWHGESGAIVVDIVLDFPAE